MAKENGLQNSRLKVTGDLRALSSYMWQKADFTFCLAIGFRVNDSYSEANATPILRCEMHFSSRLCFCLPGVEGLLNPQRRNGRGSIILFDKKVLGYGGMRFANIVLEVLYYFVSMAFYC
ncbi:hypothetical protein CDAR_373421 [Caerostris darwini]|uniref:Uncharacterized protein n=1 Tax=Caerostris darwini TaxID=1538125 RepID=A0AAV4N1E6_9ARAC|nr:hypothetical protein CDAR_373421 [Caerostris darwini]